MVWEFINTPIKNIGKKKKKKQWLSNINKKNYYK